MASTLRKNIDWLSNVNKLGSTWNMTEQYPPKSEGTNLKSCGIDPLCFSLKLLCCTQKNNYRYTLFCSLFAWWMNEKFTKILIRYNSSFFSLQHCRILHMNVILLLVGLLLVLFFVNHAYCSLRFLELWFGVCHYFIKV